MYAARHFVADGFCFNGRLPPALSTAFIRPSPSLSAMAALLKIGPAAADALAPAMVDEKAAVRLNAAYVLIRVSPEKNLALILTRAGSDPEPHVRRFLVSFLSNVSTKPAIAARIAALADKSTDVRIAAVCGFRNFNAPPDPRTAKPAMIAPDNQTLADVIKALAVSNERNRTAEWLKLIRHPGVVVAVADRLADSKPTSQNPYNHVAAALLAELAGGGPFRDPERLRSWWVANRPRYLEAAADPATQPAPTH